jgi:hypothetical protein
MLLHEDVEKAEMQQNWISFLEKIPMQFFKYIPRRVCFIEQSEKQQGGNMRQWECLGLPLKGSGNGCARRESLNEVASRHIGVSK